MTRSGEGVMYRYFKQKVDFPGEMLHTFTLVLECPDAYPDK